MQQVREIHGEPSLTIESDSVTAHMTLRGNHIAPVTFHLASGDVQPYSLAPWVPGEHVGIDPLLDVLRGDFWCLPFGEQPEGPAHGEVARNAWEPVQVTDASVHVHLDAHDVGARFDKTVSVRDGQSALFQEITITGLEGAYSYGTHPILDMSALAPGTARISTGAAQWSGVFTGVFSDPAAGETQVLAAGARFDDLSAIPMADSSELDLSLYPTPMAHEDLVMVVQQGDENHLGWSAVSQPGYVWVALKDVRDFPATVLWISNGGRTQVPWQGRHRGRMGIEDVCSYFHEGLVASRENRLASDGIPTTRPFHAGESVTLRTLQAVVATPAGFGRVAAIETPDSGMIRLTDEHGTVVDAPLDWPFVLRDHGGPGAQPR